jgi:glycosyltransferase involved in cell wall biosynthesis
MKMPEVLVVMPLYNTRPFVKTAIKSIINQTYPAFKLLIINDGSTDGSEKEVATIQDNRIIIWNQSNLGLSVTMNRALQYAHDKQIPYLARMDSDDISHPQRLEKQVQLLENFPQAAACSANCYYIDSDTESIIGTSTISTSPSLIHWEIFHGLRGLIQGVTIFRTNFLAEINGYRSQFRKAEEVDLFLRLAEKFELCNCPDYLLNIRIRQDSFSMEDVHQNVLYQFYALDCAKKRLIGKTEVDFDSFVKHLYGTSKFQIWREEYLLKLWRNYIKNQKYSGLLLAAILDPRRVCIRLIRQINS